MNDNLASLQPHLGTTIYTGLRSWEWAPKKNTVLLPQEIGTDYSFKRKIVWVNAVGFLILHLLALYGGYRLFFCHISTLVWALTISVISGVGVTLGAHRFYSHRAFKASFIVRLTVVILHTIAGQNYLYIWVRDHRQHHKYSDTDADPFNSNRGFFFAHMGWLMSKKHPLVITKGKTIDMSDLQKDVLVMIQKEHYKFLYVVLAIGVPTAVPIYGWDDTFINSFFVCFFARYIVTLHVTFLINSAAHIYGTKPYDKFMNPVDNYVISTVALGEGWHNYHHVFPSDYRTAEYGGRYSLTTLIIDILAYLGLVYDLKQTNTEAVITRAIKKGDGTHPKYAKVRETFQKNNNEIKNRHNIANG